MPTWVINIVINFVIRQFISYTHSIRWELVEKDLHERVKLIVPTAIYEQVCDIIDAALEAIKTILESSDQIRHFLELLTSNKTSEATTLLLDLLTMHFQKPHLTATEKDLKKLLMAC